MLSFSLFGLLLGARNHDEVLNVYDVAATSTFVHEGSSRFDETEGKRGLPHGHRAPICGANFRSDTSSATVSSAYSQLVREYSYSHY
jgi:hypothetical protein